MAGINDLKRRYKNNEIGIRSGSAELESMSEYKNASNAKKRKMWQSIFGSTSQSQSSKKAARTAKSKKSGGGKGG